MNPIRIAIVGVGNCASSLIQGIEYYRHKTAEDAVGLMHWDIGGFTPSDIAVVAAFDIDARKVGKDVSAAIFARPNCTTVFCAHVPRTGTLVSMGKILDGVSDHMAEYDAEETFLPADLPEATMESVVAELRASGAEILVNYLPVGSEEAVRFYAECALAAGLGFVNNMPVFIASDPVWVKRFEEKKLPLVGDDIKAQLGATITHRVLTDLFRQRGVTLDRTYQINASPARRSARPRRSSRLPPSVLMRRTSTSALQTMCRGRRTTRSVSCGWKGGCSAMSPSISNSVSASRIPPILRVSPSTPSAAARSPSRGVSGGCFIHHRPTSASTPRSSSPMILPSV